MSAPPSSRWPLRLLRWVRLAKDRNLQWRKDNQEHILQLKREQALAEQALEAELRKRQAQLQHDLNLFKAHSNAELALLKTKQRQDLKDYREYLQALDRLKLSIQRSYAHLPEALAFTIHHHAKQLLNAMWEAPDMQQRLQHEVQLLQFMATVHEEARQALTEAAGDGLPKKTLEMIGR